MWNLIFFIYVVWVIFDCKLMFGWYSSVENYVAQTEDISSRYNFYSLFQEPGTATNPSLLIHIWSFKRPSLFITANPHPHPQPPSCHWPNSLVSGLQEWSAIYHLTPIQLYLFESTKIHWVFLFFPWNVIYLLWYKQYNKNCVWCKFQLFCKKKLSGPPSCQRQKSL